MKRTSWTARRPGSVRSALRDLREECEQLLVALLDALNLPPATNRLRTWCSTCITTNRLFKDWPKVFPDALNAQVIAERFTEHLSASSRRKGVSTDEERNLTLSRASITLGLAQFALRTRARARAAAAPSRRRTVCAPPGGSWVPVTPVDLVPALRWLQRHAIGSRHGLDAVPRHRPGFL